MTFVTSLRHGWLAAMILCGTVTGSAAAQPQDVAGVRVRLEPPAGFTPAARYPGFEHAQSGASILVAEMPVPVSELRTGFTAQEFASRGMTLRSSEAITIGGREGVLLALSQRAYGNVYEKWVVVFGDDSSSVTVTGTYPAAAAAELRESLRRSVLSARLREGPMDPWEGLGFRVTETPRLRVGMRVSNAIGLNEAGSATNARPGDAALIIASSFAPADLSDVEAFARSRIQQNPGIADIRIVSGQPVTIDGILGFELIADAQDTHASLAVRMYQVVLPEGGHYILIHGVVRASQGDELVPEFRAVAQSLRRTR
jgi:hypothetical protein